MYKKFVKKKNLSIIGDLWSVTSPGTSPMLYLRCILAYSCTVLNSVY